MDKEFYVEGIKQNGTEAIPLLPLEWLPLRKSGAAEIPRSIARLQPSDHYLSGPLAQIYVPKLIMNSPWQPAH